MASGTSVLEQSLERFVADARDLLTRLKDADWAPDVEQFALALAALPALEDVNDRADAAARENRYLIRQDQPGKARRRAGRALTAKTLLGTGTAGVLMTGADVSSLVAELAGYLAGPSIPVWDYVVIDADISLRASVDVVDGWELVAPSLEDLSSMMAVPSGARYLTKPPFPLELYSGLAMLRRIARDAKAVIGWLVNLDVRPEHTLWRPLLALSLYQNQVLQLWGRYKVEPGRRLDKLFDRVSIEPWTPDGVDVVDRVMFGGFRVDDSNEDELRSFLGAVRPLLDDAGPQSEGRIQPSKRAARLRRVAEHFLTAAEDAHGEGEVLSEFNADAVLHYVIALEAVLAGDDHDKADLTRKVAQRAAIIAGTDDEDRLSIARLVRSAYGARSAYAHGGEPDTIELPHLRRVVRDCILGRLILGDRSRGGHGLAERADAALLSSSCLQDEVRGPIEDFWKTIRPSRNIGHVDA
ncbi:MAG: HEPN domain-containing protein [Actinomycetota bacterium]|nr:HEPN domain-containing protein [Actinomycetota bacterium]